MSRQGPDVLHLHCQNRTDNIKSEYFLRPYLRTNLYYLNNIFGYMRRTCPHARAHSTPAAHICSAGIPWIRPWRAKCAIHSRPTPWGHRGKQECYPSWLIHTYLLTAAKRLFALLRQRVAHPNQPHQWTHHHAHGDHAWSWNSKVATLFPIIVVATGGKMQDKMNEWIMAYAWLSSLAWRFPSNHRVEI